MSVTNGARKLKFYGASGEIRSSHRQFIALAPTGIDR